MAKLFAYYYIVGVLVLGAAWCATAEKPIWLKSNYEDELNDVENGDDSSLFNLEKRPSWVVGRDLSYDAYRSGGGGDDFNLEKRLSWVVPGKRIIEFKKDLDDQLSLIEKYEKSLRDIRNALLIQKSKEAKRPKF
jgi:hypothetical protein